MISLEPGRWPKLLAPIRTRNPPCRAGPYQRSAELLSTGSRAPGVREDKQKATEEEEEENIDWI